MLTSLLLLFLISYTHGCERVPSIYHSRVDRRPGDNGFQIKINENPEKYVPGKLYTMYLTGTRTNGNAQHFTRFTINVESAADPSNTSPQNVGNFQLYADNLSKFNEECVNTLSEVNTLPKAEVFFMWSAPAPGSGCVTFRAMVLEDPDHWYADDGTLSKTFCEMTDKDAKFDENDCCACDEAKYNLIFEGIWSNTTHPKDFPTLLWLTHFSDIVGASHEKNFTFWGEGQLASEGFRSLAEWGSIRLMETELRAKAKYLKTLIKAAGLWYPNVNQNTTTTFKVDRRHNLISLASMLGPTPDWVVGVNGLNLCLKNCTWIENLVVDLFPYDAGTDSGITYMSPNAETKPRERIYRITTMYPEDPRAPFYDPTKKEIPALARLYLRREKLISKGCDDTFLSAQLDISENTEDTTRPECATTEYSNWSECSVTCGKGLRMRTRTYIMPQKAQMFQCNRQLISKEMCVAAVPECEGSQDSSNENLLDVINSDDLDSNTGVCSTTPWGEYSECSATCGKGFRMKNRKFLDRMGRKKCPHISLVEKEVCMNPVECSSQPEIVDPMCPTTGWSDWSPCSATCGQGIKLRTRLLLVDPALQEKCSSRVELQQQTSCSELADCGFDMATAKVVCMQEREQGPCQGTFNRWYFESRKLMCIPFIYGGCRGNRNNFLTQEECTDSCSIVRDALSGNQSPPISQTNPNPTTNSDQNQYNSFSPFRTNFDSFGNDGTGRVGNGARSNSLDTAPQRVDCMVTEWGPWGHCSVTCGVGTQERFRMIKRQPQNGGTPCPLRLVRRKKCSGPPCFH